MNGIDVTQKHILTAVLLAFVVLSRSKSLMCRTMAARLFETVQKNITDEQVHGMLAGVSDNEVQDTFVNVLETLSDLSKTTPNAVPEVVAVPNELSGQPWWVDTLDLLIKSFPRKMSPSYSSFIAERTASTSLFLKGLLDDERFRNHFVSYSNKTNLFVTLWEAFDQFCIFRGPVGRSQSI